MVLVDADPHLGAVAVLLDLAEDRSQIYLAHEAALQAVDDGLVLRHMQTVFGLDVLTGRSVAGLGEVVAGPFLAEVVSNSAAGGTTWSLSMSELSTVKLPRQLP